MRLCKAVFVVAAGVLLLTNAGWAQPAYHVTYINTFDEKNEALDISDSGRYVCGYYLEGGGGTAQRAYLYDTGDKSVTDLSSLIEAEIGGGRTIGYGVNDAGQVVGQAYYIDGGTGKTTGFLYDHTSKAVTKLELVDSDEGSAMDISNAGRVVGYSHAPAWQAFYYDGTVHGLGGFPSQGASCFAYGINESDHVAGSAYKAGGQDPSLWNAPPGPAQDLGLNSYPQSRGAKMGNV